MGQTSSYQLRIIDAGINRIGEGLRVLEEFARLSLNDADLTRRLKNMRHKMVRLDAGFQQRLIGARDAAGDVGAGMKAGGEEGRREAAATIIANARRVQESLRVMEELAKEPGSSLTSADFESARFDLYTIEKQLLAGVLRREKAGRITGLYVIVDVGSLKGRSPLEAAAAAIGGGTKIIQLRDKKGSRKSFFRTALELQKLCRQKDVLFIVNDSLEIALAVGADGLNIGREDLPLAEARLILPIDSLLGVSARTVGEARAAQAAGADYLGVGSVYPTGTKTDAEVIGLAHLKKIKQSVALPVVAIGGINKDNLSDVIKAGADAAAVISAVMDAEDIEKATRQLVKIIKGEKRG